MKIENIRKTVQDDFIKDKDQQTNRIVELEEAINQLKNRPVRSVLVGGEPGQSSQQALGGGSEIDEARLVSKFINYVFFVFGCRQRNA